MSEPNSAKMTVKLGVALAELGQVGEGTRYLQQAVAMDPFDVEIRLTIARTYLSQERRDEAIKQLRDAIRFMLEHDRRDEVRELQDFLDTINRDNSAFIM